MFFIRLVVLLCLGSIAGVGAAVAQPASQPQPSPAQVAAARDVAISSGMTRSFDSILPQFSEAMRKQAVSRPEITKDLEDVLAKLQPELELQKQVMINNAARILAQSLSEAELKDIAKFFQSPAGKRYVQTQPQVLDEIVRTMQTWTESVSEYVMVRVRAEMNKRGHAMQ
jgi:hypothetical protein